MRTQLTIACLAALSQAVNLATDYQALAQTNASQACCNHSKNTDCNPCPGDADWKEFSADTDHKKKDKIDVTKDFLRDFAEIGDEFIHQSKVDAILRKALGIDMAKEIESHVVKPIFDAAVGEMIPVHKIADVIKGLNTDESIKIVDDLPDAQVIVDKEIEEAAEKDEGVVFHNGMKSDPKDLDNATVEELHTPNGDVLIAVIPHGFDGQKVDEVSGDEIADLADDAAKDMVDDLAAGETPEATKKEEEPEPVKKEPVVEEPVELADPRAICQVHTFGEDKYDLTSLRKPGDMYISDLWDWEQGSNGKVAAGQVRWNYCEEVSEGIFASYWSGPYGYAAIADTSKIEDMKVDEETGEFSFGLETSKVCDTDSSKNYKFITHLTCDENADEPVYPDSLKKAVYYNEPCEYHVRFAHKAGCKV